MGNTVVTPIKHATNSFATFIKSLKPEDFKTGCDRQSFVDNMAHEFEVFLEDFIMNDEEFQKFDANGAKHCVALLLLEHANFSKYFDGEHARFATRAVVEKWAEGKSCHEILKNAVQSGFVYQGEQFFALNTSTKMWDACDESSVRLDNTANNFDSDLKVETFGLKAPVVSEACEWISHNMNNWKEGIETFNEVCLPDAINHIRERGNVKLNCDPRRIPCLTSTVSLTKCTSRPHKVTDMFSVCLPYDPAPVKEITDTIRSFFRAFNCSDEQLATVVINWGCSLNPSLTVVSGPSCSGKSTLVKFVQKLYGPFVASSLEHEAGNVNYDLVRTCFYDDVNLTEDEIKNHPCSHIVLVVTEDTIDDNYAGRIVNRLKFVAPINESNIKEGIINNVTTLKQLSSGLAWLLSNNIVGGSSSMPSMLANMLMGGGLAGSAGSAVSAGLASMLLGGSGGSTGLLSMLMSGGGKFCSDSDCSSCSKKSIESNPCESKDENETDDSDDSDSDSDSDSDEDEDEKTESMDTSSSESTTSEETTPMDTVEVPSATPSIETAEVPSTTPMDTVEVPSSSATKIFKIDATGVTEVSSV